MKNSIKLLIIYLLRILLRVFYIFPIKKNYILFASFEGRQYSDNPKYLFEYINKNFGDKYKYIWVMNNKSLKIKNVETVKFLSIKHIYYLLTCKYLISNLGIEPFIPKRKNQIFLNTWHGSGAYKSQTLSSKTNANKYNLNMRDYRSKHTDFYNSGCKKYSEIMSISWNASLNKFISTGTPRNDIFFTNNLEEIKTKISNQLNLSSMYGYILYAPTYRGKSFRTYKGTEITIDIDGLLTACKKRFGKEFKLLFREHSGALSKKNVDNNVIDVSFYPDMQELLVFADILITDYSSSMWDFCFTSKPGFLFVPDLLNYLNERDFYTEIDTWPYPYARSNEELFVLVENYNKKNALDKINTHLKLLNNFENGNACKETVEVLKL